MPDSASATPDRTTAATASPPARPLRLLAVQAQDRMIPEHRVFKSLLEILPRFVDEEVASTGDGDGDTPVNVLLLQGVDTSTTVERGHTPIAGQFRRVPGVDVHEMRVGRLGRQDITTLARAMKVRDLLRVGVVQRGLPAVARRFRPDVVYSSQQRWDLRLAAPLARELGCPLVVHLHYTVGPWLGRGAVDALREAAMVIGVSDYIRDDAVAHGVPAGWARTLYNSIVVPPEAPADDRAAIRSGLRAELGLPDGAVLVGMAARLNKEKGQEELTRAMLPILARRPDAHLLLAGYEYPAGNGMAGRIKGSAEAHGVAAQVHLLGYRRDVSRILDGLDLFAHPSRAEPCPLAVLEAMAHGLPVVAWREGGPAEQIVDGQTGLLVEPMDIAGLTAALESLIADGEACARMGARGRERAAMVFSPERAGSSFLSLLELARQTGQTGQAGGGGGRRAAR